MAAAEMLSQSGGGTQLPTAKQLLETVNDEGECRHMLWRILQYGSTVALTTATIPSTKSPDKNATTTSTSTTINDSTTNGQQHRVEEAARILADALPESTVLQGALVDAIWLWSTTSFTETTTIEDTTTPSSSVAGVTASLFVSLLLKSLATAVPSLTSFWEDVTSTLDSSLLEQAGLIVSEKDLLKKVRMLNTQLYYRQQKYNLLQEESQGYAKLVALLLLLPKPQQQQQQQQSEQENGSNHHNQDASSSTNITHHQQHHQQHLHQHHQLTHQVRTLIGTFELDPNRVLDLIIDVMELKFIQSDESTTTTTNTTTTALRPLLTLMNDFSLTKLPPLLGFKMKERGTTSTSELNGMAMAVVPDSLIQVMVLLATEQLLDLRHLTPYYAKPVDTILQEAAQLYRALELERVQSIGRVRLNDANSGGSAQAEAKRQLDRKKQLQDLQSQLQHHVLIRLLQVLLERGEWDLAKTTMPSLQAWSDLCMLLPQSFAMLLCDLVQERIQPVYLELVKTPPLVDVDATVPAVSITKKDKGILVPSATLEQVLHAISEPLLCTVDSGCIAQRPLLYCQLCRLVRQLLLQTKENDPLSASAYHFLNSFLVPSLSLLSPSPSISTELWLVLSELPYTTRYRLYRDWHIGAGGGIMHTTSKPLRYLESDIAANKEARYHLKRLSKDNVRDMGRQVSKVTHASPLVVFSAILSQVESYDNLIQMMVEAVRFVTPLGLDVLSYCIFSRLSDNNNNNTLSTSGVNRNRLKEDGVNVSQWLQSLESFIGAFYKKCPHVEFRGILHYLIRRLKDGHVMELGVLKTLIKDAGGYGFADYSPAASLSTTQLEGRAGSILLKRETMSFGVVETVNSRTVERIRSVLLSDNIGVSLLILLAQLKPRILFEASSSSTRPKPVKLIGNLFDSCQVVMSILLEFLTNSIGDEATGNGSGQMVTQNFVGQFAASMPSFRDLVEKFGLDVASAWLLCRPLVRLANSRKAQEATNDPIQAFGLSESMRAAYKAVLPETTWQDISCDLYEIFFSSTLYDLFCPEDGYKAESDRVSKEVERLIQRRKGAPQSSLMTDTRFSKADEDELERTRNAITILASDLEKQKIHVTEVKQMIESKKSDLFPDQRVSATTVNTFITHCVYPRCMQSPEDAVYCARFVAFLHAIDTPGFSTLHFLDELILVLAGAMYGLTEAEAANVAILLTEIWRVVSAWRYDKDLFEREVEGKVGSFMVKEDSTVPDKSPVAVSYQGFESIYNKWHAAVGAAALGCLKSSEYMHTRSGLVVLTRMVDVFPTKPRLAQSLVAALEPFQAENYPLQDIKTSAQAYGTLLVKARDEGAWKEEDASVTRARVEKEQAAAALRKKQAEERFAEMNRESRQIQDSLGGGDNRLRGRDDRRRVPSRGDLNDLHKSPSVPLFEPPTKSDEQSRKVEQTPPRPHTPTVENGRDKDRLPRDGRDQDQGDQLRRPREGEPSAQRDKDRDHVGTDRSRARSDSNPPQSRNEERPQSSESRRREGVLQLATSGPLRQEREEPRGQERRWVRGEPPPPQGARNRSKRGRSPDEGEGAGDEQKREEHPAKRSRMELGNSGHPDFEPRQGAGRGVRGESPPRRTNQAPQQPPQKQPPASQQEKQPQQSRGRRSRR